MPNSFESAVRLSDHQIERELREALRVQSMSADARWQWLQIEWGALQDCATLLFQKHAPPRYTSHSFATLADKNRFDEAVELERALRMSIHCSQ